jgi:hypothetical protein
MRGRIYNNGNIEDDRDYICQMAPRLLESSHSDPSVRASKKCLLVTAGWMENEYQEGHLKTSLAKLGIPAHLKGAAGDNLQNLSLFHSYQDFLNSYPEFRDSWHAREQLIESARHLYLEKNSFYVELLRRSLNNFRDYFPSHSLSSAWSYLDEVQMHSGGHFGHQRLGDFLAKNLKLALHSLQENDDGLVQLLHDLDLEYVTSTGLHFHPAWIAHREELTRRILSSNSILIFGGHLGGLHRCLNFFRLGEVLSEALRRGTSFYTVSAGSLICCERVIVFNDFDSDFGERREFQLFDRGFGLVKSLQLFPHCMDRIQTDDPDNLAYLSLRFRNRTCVGLNQGSILETVYAPEQRCSSVGKADGVYVFNAAGQKLCYSAGQTID